MSCCGVVAMIFSQALGDSNLLCIDKATLSSLLRCQDVVAVSRDSYVRCIEGLVLGGGSAN